LILAALSALGLLLTLAILPETKGKDLEQISGESELLRGNLNNTVTSK